MSGFTNANLLVLLLAVLSPAAADAGEFPRSLELQDGAFRMQWEISGDALRLRLEAPVVGWLAWGIAETTGMRGADIVYYEHAGGRLVDSYATRDGKPTEDQCQDWALVATETSGGKLAVELTRKLVTNDPQDRAITHDAAASLFPTRIVAAWGDSAEIQYHCSTCRVAASVRLFGSGGETGEDSFDALRADTSLQSHDIIVPNFQIPSVSVTTYKVSKGKHLDVIQGEEGQTCAREPSQKVRKGKHLHVSRVMQTCRTW